MRDAIKNENIKSLSDNCKDIQVESHGLKDMLEI